MSESKHSKPRRSFLQTFTLLLFCVSALTAQERPRQQEKKPEQDEQVATIRVNTDLVSIEVAVTDRAGLQSNVKLGPEDFVVYEDGVRQKISNFSAADTPFNLVLLIDTSGSTREDLGLIRRAARRFLDEMRLQDRIAVVQFNQQVELIKDLTANRSELEAALDNLQAGSGTSFYDALQLTIDDVLGKVAGRKAIVALTDGVDSFGYGVFKDVLPKLETAGASVYFLELDTEKFAELGMTRDCTDTRHFKFSRKQIKKYHDEAVTRSDSVPYERHCFLTKEERREINRRLYEAAHEELLELAEKTGGRVYPVQELGKLDTTYAQIAAALRTQYSLAYYPSNERHDGKWRKLRVEIKRPGLQARTRPGYRAPVD
jgi:VWFA-related protein